MPVDISALSADPLIPATKIDRLYRLRTHTARKAALAGLIPSASRPRGSRSPTILIRLSDAEALWGTK